MPPFCHHCAAHHAETCSEYQARLSRLGHSILYDQSILDMVREQAEVATLEHMYALPAREPGR